MGLGGRCCWELGDRRAILQATVVRGPVQNKVIKDFYSLKKCVVQICVVEEDFSTRIGLR